VTIAAVGDHALVRSVGELKLVGLRGVLAHWSLPDYHDHGDGEVDFFGDIISRTLLAHPPRFALLRATGRRVQRRIARIEQSWVEIIDALTGEVHLRVDAPLRSLVAFDPDGAFLFANSDGGLVIVDDEGRVRPINGAPHVRSLSFSRDGRFALALSSWNDSRVVGIDLGDTPSVRWTNYEVDALAAVMGADGARGLVLVAADAAFRLRTLESVVAGRGERILRTSITVEDRLDVPLRSFAADASLQIACALDDDGALTVFRAASDGWTRAQVRLSRDVVVDVEHNRVLEAGVGVYLRDLAGTLIRTSAYATRMCFAGTGPAAVLVGGAVHTLDETGTHLIDGAGNLVDIATHARGVIALDDRDCAHVVEVPR
jgi:hypothetical protein